MISLGIQTFIYLPRRVQLLHQDQHRKLCTCERVFSLKINDFIPCNRVVMFRNFPGKPFEISFSRYSKSYFLKTTGFISLIKFEIKIFVLEEISSIGDFSICVPSIRVMTVRKVRKVPYIIFSLDIQTYIPRPLQYRIHPSRFQSKT